MKISDFNYDLPLELIAQTPIEPRDASRLLVVQRATGTFEHRHFRDLGDFLRPGDLLIANQSRVIPARLLGYRAETKGAVEVLLLTERNDLGPDHWETLVRPGRRLREGARIYFGPQDQAPRLIGEIQQRTEAGGRIVHFWTPEQEAGSSGSADPYQVLSVRQRIDEIGRMPLPPYIHETLEDQERYQTVYARIQGSAAAPTAGLHFTPELLERLRQQGVRTGFVTLHVGLDTFRPVEHENVSEHKMHSEEIELDSPTAELINETKKAGGRVIAVGTTSVRVLESVASFHNGEIAPYKGSTRLFITPGTRFQAVDAMITNFHLPRSTLLLLVSAFMGKELMEQAYQEAIKERYRFFSFGDAMLLL
ncbi:tRNA preQ1(34) S-adenosylmethionine ribosyltransferase-isomerase QueA [Dictyobacter kobayashii]|uniref:tRNA preQ1(34) S-adenosylmethionine ribosyltransferase-isomerase QueA n=1 Tax=Dictyobacter kobayashii TaxID=2014872 RepID=UPI000F847B69